MARGCGVGIGKQDVRRVLDLPFDSERKRMTTLHSGRGGIFVYTKGAPESVFACCRAMATETGEVPFDSARAMGAAEAMAQDGLRVLAVASRRWDVLPDQRTPDLVERDLTLLGLVGLLDPPRAEAKAAVDTCRTAGITVVMITGDHPVTARAIAHQIGILANDGTVLTGRDRRRCPIRNCGRPARSGACPRRSSPEDPHCQGVAGRR
jgi:Ca2+-transporting ATPase